MPFGSILFTNLQEENLVDEKQDNQDELKNSQEEQQENQDEQQNQAEQQNNQEEQQDNQEDINMADPVRLSAPDVYKEYAVRR